MTYFLAIDQGTHASRACLFDKTGRLVSEYTKNIKLNRISNHFIEQDATEIIDSVKEVVERLLHEADKQHEIISCGIAIQRSSVVAWSDDGTAISPVLSWQDTRGSQQVDALRDFEDEIQQLSGLPLSAHYGASKMHYLFEQTSKHNRTSDNLRLSPLISYLLFHIIEQHPYIVDHTNAQRTQLFAISDMQWSVRLAKLFDVPLKTLPVCVPVLISPGTAHGKLAGTEIPVCAISGDQNAAFFGTGNLTPQTALVNFGSGAFVLSLLTRYRSSNRQLSTIACSENSTAQYVREATINGAGSALSWLAKKHDVKDVWDQLPGWLEEIEQPPVFINTVGGLGSPWWNNIIEPHFITDPSESGNTAQGLPPQAVAVIESIVFMVCANLEIMQHEQTLARLRVSGGLSQLDGLCQRLADLSGLTLERVEAPEATARGIAWLAAGKPEDWSRVATKMFEPAICPGLKKRYASFNDSLKRLL